MEIHELGRLGERLACDFLVRRGYRCVTMNYRTRFGEIDLVMRDKHGIVFVEVKTRRAGNQATPNDELSWYKLRRVEAAAQLYCTAHGVTEWRMEAVAVTVDQRRNKAFIRLIPI